MADNARLHSTSSPTDSAVGQDLREARESLGLSVAQMADTLRIRAAHIEALEEGRFGDLPGRTYAFGFARSIARHLGLDPELVASRLRDEITGTSAPSELVFPESTEDNRLSRTGWILISIFAVVVAYGGWIMVSKRGDDRPAEFSSDTAAPQQVPDVVVPSPDAEPSAPAPTDSASSSPDTQDQAAAPATPGVPAPSAAPGAPSPTTLPAPRAGTPAPTAAPSASGTGGSATTQPPQAEDDVDVTPQPAEVAGAPAAAAGRIVIRARQDSWVQVQGSNGAIVFAKTLRAGESYTVPDQNGLRLTVGNAGGIDVVVDGQVTPSLGQVGVVRRNVALDATRLKGARGLE